MRGVVADRASSLEIHLFGEAHQRDKPLRSSGEASHQSRSAKANDASAVAFASCHLSATYSAGEHLTAAPVMISSLIASAEIKAAMPRKRK